VKDFKGGVGWYSKMWVPVYFPEDDVVCIHCPLLREEFAGGYKRYFCKRTGEIIPLPANMTGLSCPGEVEVTNCGTGESKENTIETESPEGPV
jgi:hypothetical protein